MSSNSTAIKFKHGQQYELKGRVELKDGTVFEPGEKFTYDIYAGMFMSDYDQAPISKRAASSYLAVNNKPLFEEI